MANKCVYLLVAFLALSLPVLCLSDEYRLLGVEDLEFAGGGTGAAETNTSTGGVVSTQIDATHIMLRSRAESVEGAITDNAIITGGTLDGTVIGGTTPAAGTFTSIIRGSVSDMEFSYLDGVTSSIQTQLNAKQASDTDLTTLASPTAWRFFYSNGLSAITELALGASGTYLKSTGASSAPIFDTPAGSGTDNVPIQWNVLGVSDNDNTLLFKAWRSMTVTELNCITGGTDNVTVTLLECNSSGGSCADGGISVVATSSGASDTSFTDAVFDADDWIKVTYTTVGTTTTLSCRLKYE